MIAWLIPGLPLLLAGEFLPVPELLIAAPLATALAVNALHRVPSRWPRELPSSQADRRWMSWWALLGTMAVAGGFTAWQLVLNSTSLIVSRTPAVSFQTGYWIAQHGSLPITAPLTAFGRSPAALHLASIGFYQDGHAVVPAVTAGLPMLLTAGFWTSGVAGGAVLGPVIGGLAVLSFGGLVGRLAGRQWAPAGALALAVTLPEIFTSRDSFAETAVQVLLFGGLSLVIDALTLSRDAGGRRVPAEAAGRAGQGSGEAVGAGRPTGAENGGGAALAAARQNEPSSAAGQTKPYAAGPGDEPAQARAGDAGQAAADEAADDAADDAAKPYTAAGEAGTVPGRAHGSGADGAADDADGLPGVGAADDVDGLAGDGAPGDADGLAGVGAAWKTQPLPIVGERAAPSASAGKSATNWRRGRPWRRRARWLPGGARQPVVSRPRAITWRDAVSATSAALTAERIAALLGGLSLGLTLLISPGSLVLLLPAIPVAGVLIAARRAVGVAFWIGIVIGTGYGIAAGYLLARPLMDSIAPELELAAVTGAGLAVVTAAVLRLLRLPRVSGASRKALARRPLRWVPGLGAVAVIAGMAFLAIRPYLQTVRGRMNGTTAHYVAALQRIEHLKIDPGQLYAEDTMYWVFWYVGIAALLLGAFAAAALVRRSLRAMLSWQDPSGARLNWALPVAVLVGSSAAVLWQPHTVPDQPWASRRLVPAVIPMLILFATWAAGWLTRRARERGAGGLTALAVSVFCVGAMLLPSVSTSFGAGLTHSGTGGGLRPSAGGLAQHRVAAGEADAIRGMCASIGRSSSVVIVDWQVAQMFTQVVRGECGVPVAWVPQGTSTADVNALLGSIARAGRRPVVLGARPGQVAGFGGHPTLVLNLTTNQDSHELAQAPGAPWTVRYLIWMVAAAVPNVGV